MNKTFKKVLSVVLALAMVVTSITVTNLTAKADVAEIVVTATVNDKGTIDANWTNPEGTASLKYYINEESEGKYARNGAAGWTWSVNNPTEIRTYVDGVSESHDGTVKVTDGGNFTIIVVAYDEAGEVIARGTSNVLTIAAYVNADMKLFVERYDEGDMLAFLKWNTVTGAVNYKAYDADGNEVANSNGDWTSVKLPSKNVEYTYTVKAYDASGNEIAVTNNTATAIIEGEETTTTPEEETSAPEETTTVAKVAPEEHDITKVDTSKWDKLTVKVGSVDKEYSINSTHGLSTSAPGTGWWGICAPHSEAQWHVDRPNCILGDAAAFTFQQRDIKEIWVNGNLYGNPSTAFNNDGDFAEISVNVLTEEENVITLVMKDGTMKTFAIQVKGEEAPDTSAVDTSAWTVIPVSGADSATVVNTYSMNTTGYETYVNTAIYGVYAPASATAYHNGTCNIVGAAIGIAIDKCANAGSVWVDGKKYVAGSENVHVRENSIEIALSLFNDAGTHYVSVVGSETATFAIKTEAPKAEVAPDQTLAEVTDWVKVGTVADANDVSADGNFYYVSKAFRDEYVAYNDIFGLYTDHTTSPWHDQMTACSLTGAGYISAIPKAANDMKSVWVDGVKYTSGTEECYLQGDQIHLAQSIFALSTGETEKVFAVTVRTSTEDYTYALKVAKAPKYNVTLDNAVVATVVEGYSYTFENDYVIDGKPYKAGTVTVNSDITAETLNVALTMTNGASIKLTNPSGMRFKTTVDSNVSKDYVQYGTLIAAADEIALPEVGSGAIDIVTNVWADDTSYIGAIVNINESNFDREIIARGYATINYANAEAEVVYSDITVTRTVNNVLAAAGLTADALK